MIIGFSPLRNWKGANLVTHELQISPPTPNEAALHFLSASSPYFSGESRLGLSCRGNAPVVLGTLLE